MPCFLIAGTSFHFFTNLHCLLGEFFKYGSFSSLKLPKFLRIFLLYFLNENWSTVAPSLSFDFSPTRCALSVFLLLVFISNFSYNNSNILFWHSSNDFGRSSLIPSIRKLFLLDPSSRFANFLQISNSRLVLSFV